MGYVNDYCSGCKKLFKVKNKVYNENKRDGYKNYCNKKCFNDYRRKKSVKQVQCSVCGININRYKKLLNSNNRYFCRKCRGTMELNCFVCDKKIIRNKHDLRKYKKICCSEKCRAIGSLKEWLKISRCMLKDHWIRVFGVDKLFCTRCGHNKIYNIVIHHKIYASNGGDNNPENLEPLCRNCHGEEHYEHGVDRGEWLSTNSKLIRKIK